MFYPNAMSLTVYQKTVQIENIKAVWKGFKKKKVGKDEQEKDKEESFIKSVLKKIPSLFC